MKKIVFLTGTRADFGKLKSLIEISTKNKDFEVFIFVTGMHLSELHGSTYIEIEKCGYKNIHKFNNHEKGTSMDEILANTIYGFSSFCKKIQPDLIIVHGDRVEALAGAITGALNNILVAHIEGGEVSGTIDELIRHSVSKMSHIHFVANEIARDRLIQMGELTDSIFVIGSPDIDAMLSKNLPTLDESKERYDIPFESYAISMFHPVTTEYEFMETYTKNYIEAIKHSDDNFIVIYPNNDLGFEFIIKEINTLKNKKNIKIFPSIRFEHFITLLKHSSFIIGNSSAGIREAPYYGIPTVNVGTRQNNRSLNTSILNSSYDTSEIISTINKAKSTIFKPEILFGKGNSDELFFNIISDSNFWSIDKQKQFKDLKI